MRRLDLVRVRVGVGVRVRVGVRVHSQRRRSHSTHGHSRQDSATWDAAPSSTRGHGWAPSSLASSARSVESPRAARHAGAQARRRAPRRRRRSRARPVLERACFVFCFCFFGDAAARVGEVLAAIRAGEGVGLRVQLHVVLEVLLHLERLRTRQPEVGWGTQRKAGYAWKWWVGGVGGRGGKGGERRQK